MIRPDWPAPGRVRAFATTRELGDLKDAAVRRKLRALLPAEPPWLKQVHGVRVIDLDRESLREGDAAVTRTKGVVCGVQMADCMPVLFADDAGTTVAAAHAGWRGLAAGVLEATLAQMRTSHERIVAWLGPAAGPASYEIGHEVFDAFVAQDPGSEAAFTPTRAGHWRMDLYALARRRLARAGVTHVHGGGFDTIADRRFFSHRRSMLEGDGRTGRMATLAWVGK